MLQPDVDPQALTQGYETSDETLHLTRMNSPTGWKL